ncbi:unnamed protein product, partial [Symbiodinium sp. CCMP2456]
VKKALGRGDTAVFDNHFCPETYINHFQSYYMMSSVFVCQLLQWITSPQRYLEDQVRTAQMLCDMIDHPLLWRRCEQLSVQMRQDVRLTFEEGKLVELPAYVTQLDWWQSFRDWWHATAEVESASAGTLVVGLLLCREAPEARECGARMLVEFAEKLISPSLRTIGENTDRSESSRVTNDPPRTRVTVDLAAAEWAKAQQLHLKAKRFECHVPLAGLINFRVIRDGSG